MYLLYKYYPAARTTHSEPGDSEKPHIIEQFTSLLLVSIVAARMICTSIVSGDNLIFTIRPQTGPNIETFWKCQVTYNCRNHCSLMICYCLTYCDSCVGMDLKHNFFFQMKKIIQITMIIVITTPGSITLIVALCLKFVVKLLIHSAIKKEK